MSWLTHQAALLAAGAAAASVAALVPVAPERRAGRPPPPREPTPLGRGIRGRPVWQAAAALLRGRRRDSRSDSMTTAELLAALAAEVRAGSTPDEALRAVADASGTTLSATLRLAAAADEPTGELARAPGGASAAGRQVAACWQVAAATGAPLGAVLERAAGAARADVAVARRARAALAGPRSSALLMCALPVLTLALGHAVGARPASVLASPVGALCLGIGLPLLAAGLACTVWLGRRAVPWG